MGLERRLGGEIREEYRAIVGIRERKRWRRSKNERFLKEQTEFGHGVKGFISLSYSEFSSFEVRVAVARRLQKCSVKYTRSFCKVIKTG